MNKAQLIDALAERLGDKKVAAAAVAGLVDVVIRTVNSGDKVTITGFGVFERRARAARMARNPRTGESVKVKKTTVPAFRPGTQFREVVRGTRSLALNGAGLDSALPLRSGTAPAVQPVAIGAAPPQAATPPATRTETKKGKEAQTAKVTKTVKAAKAVKATKPLNEAKPLQETKPLKEAKPLKATKVGITKVERKSAKASLDFTGTAKKGVKGSAKAVKEVADSAGKKAVRKSGAKKLRTQLPSSGSS